MPSDAGLRVRWQDYLADQPSQTTWKSAATSSAAAPANASAATHRPSRADSIEWW